MDMLGLSSVQCKPHPPIVAFNNACVMGKHLCRQALLSGDSSCFKRKIAFMTSCLPSLLSIPFKTGFILKENILKEKNLRLVEHFCPSTLKEPETKIAEFSNIVDLDEVAHNGPSHLD